MNKKYGLVYVICSLIGTTCFAVDPYCKNIKEEITRIVDQNIVPQAKNFQPPKLDEVAINRKLNEINNQFANSEEGRKLVKTPGPQRDRPIPSLMNQMADSVMEAIKSKYVSFSCTFELSHYSEVKCESPEDVHLHIRLPAVFVNSLKHPENMEILVESSRPIRASSHILNVSVSVDISKDGSNETFSAPSIRGTDTLSRSEGKSIASLNEFPMRDSESLINEFVKLHDGLYPDFNCTTTQRTRPRRVPHSPGDSATQPGSS